MSNFRIIALIPHYNHETTLPTVIQSLREYNLPCMIIDDGSEPSAQAVVQQLCQNDHEVTAIFRPQNGGKGSAMKDGLHYAIKQNYTHALQIDADAQHTFADIPKMIQTAQESPYSMICGYPIYDESAPKSRLYGRKITNFWIRLHTGSHNIKDGMCGFRVYPLIAIKPILQHEKVGNRMDFDIDILVRLQWHNISMIWIDTPVQYQKDSISHFHLWQDNWLISKTHARLFLTMCYRRLTRQFHKDKYS